MKTLLDKLSLQDVNPGVCTGPEAWLDTGRSRLTSYNPTTGEPIAQVQQATPEAYNQAIEKARQAFQDWRIQPAPKRGDLIRDLGNALRQYKEPLGDLGKA